MKLPWSLPVRMVVEPTSSTTFHVAELMFERRMHLLRCHRFLYPTCFPKRSSINAIDEPEIWFGLTSGRLEAAGWFAAPWWCIRFHDFELECVNFNFAVFFSQQASLAALSFWPFSMPMTRHQVSACWAQVWVDFIITHEPAFRLQRFWTGLACWIASLS